MTVEAKTVLPRVLTIAGSDSGGGAGIQADIKTFTAIGAYGASVITALTAQNTLGVQGIHACPVPFVEQQLDSVLSDIGADALKTGMLFDAATVEAVAAKVAQFSLRNLVVDPVMVATSGHSLVVHDTVRAIIDSLLPLATLVTPNVPEAEVLATIISNGNEFKVASLTDMHIVARLLHRTGSKYVLVKGGHLPLDVSVPKAERVGVKSGMNVVDVLFDGETIVEFWKPHIETKNTHGTGCTLSAAVTAHLALGKDVFQAVEAALLYVANAIASAVNIGQGNGPLNHLHTIVKMRAVTKNNFLQILKDSCKKEWDEYINHPFVRGLADGTLNQDCFKHYIRQDYIYLLHYARGYALAAFKEQRMDDIATAASIAMGIARESKDVHVKYCESWGISLDDLESTKEATANLSYTRYFLEKGLCGDRLDLYVAMAPCLIGYGEIGLKLMNDPATKRKDNLYWDWISNYGKEDFQQAVVDGEARLAQLFEETVPSTNTTRLQQLCEIFRQATILEIKFWDS
ncbi:thiamine biosynthesis protein [Chytriomyces sp. MP71]|nr:thiamine biosynthesis protein [Chytriomyces sp. MP71]